MFGVELPLVLSVFSPVFNINVGHSIKDHLEFVGLEHTNQVLGYNLVNTVLYSVKGSFDGFSAQLFHTKDYKPNHTKTQYRDFCWNHQPQCLFRFKLIIFP